MPHFNPELWRKRSWAKHQRSSLNKDEADRQRLDDERGIANLERIVRWCDGRGVEVVFCRRSGAVYLGQQNMIRVSDRMSPRLQAYFLLHECGHFLVGARDKHERFGMGWHTDDERDKRTFHHRCDVVEEEFEAWYRGWRLAQRLRLDIDKGDYDRIRIKNLKTYLCWSLKVNGFSDRGVAPDVDADRFDGAGLQTGASVE